MAHAPTLRLVLGDQLTDDVAALRGIEPERDLVLMAEVLGEATYVKHHKQKLALIFGAMRWTRTATCRGSTGRARRGRRASATWWRPPAATPTPITSSG